VVVLVSAGRKKMKTESVKLFLLSELDEKLNRGLTRELFDTKPLSDSDFSDVKGFFDIKLLSSFSFPELSNSGNNIE
jgi:hypothetical protein